MWRDLPAELWAAVGAHLAVMDRVTLFWTLWRARVLAHANIATCYRHFLEPPAAGRPLQILPPTGQACETTVGTEATKTR